MTTQSLDRGWGFILTWEVNIAKVLCLLILIGDDNDDRQQQPVISGIDCGAHE